MFIHEGLKVYDIFIVATDDHIINRLNTADITFALSSDKIAYEISAAEYITLTHNTDYPDRYMFNFNGKDDVEDTARYSVTLTDDKTLNFWNNVMDNAIEVEDGKATSAVVKNFLAGDIVKDNNINIYDLSAVVSYFGTENCVADHPEYAKYDLNRDGVIDSKDVAYVLVSWGE